MMHFWEGFAHLDLRFMMILGLRTLWYAFFVVRERPEEFRINFSRKSVGAQGSLLVG